MDQCGRVTGIVDWECAGWYPEYWEYTKAHFAVRYTIVWLADVVDRVFTGYRRGTLCGKHAFRPCNTVYRAKIRNNLFKKVLAVFLEVHGNMIPWAQIPA